MKRGITEAADIVLVNKAEEPLSTETRKTIISYRTAAQYMKSKHPLEVFPVSAHFGHGIDLAWRSITEFHRSIEV